MIIAIPVPAITFVARYGNPLPTWQQGLVATSVRVTISDVNSGQGPFLVTASVFDNAPTINMLATESIMMVDASDMIFNLAISSNQYDLDRVTVYAPPGMYFPGRVFVEVFTNVSDFWTDFVKSYEIP